MSYDNINEEVLAAYLKGELDPAQAAEVEQWYDASAANRRELGQVYYILFLNDRIRSAEAVDIEASLQRLKTRMHTKPESESPFRRIAWKVAAAVVLGAVLLTGGWSVSSIAKQLSQPLAVYTDLNERSQVVLPDGTKVWLNSCSRLEYSKSFFSRERRVKMDGEAYFEVEHDKRAPFIVHTHGLDIRVLGTKFNMRHSQSQHTVTTVLLEGSVMARATGFDHTAVRLKPAQQLVFNTENGRMLLSDDNRAEQTIDWIDGRIRFEQNTFEEIAAELNRYYNVEIRFADDSLRQERFSGDFKLEDGIYHIMSILQLTYKFHYKVNQSDIELYANRP